MFNIFEQPWTLFIPAIIAWFILLLLHADSRLWWQTHLVIFLTASIFILNILVDTELLKISKTLTTIIQVILILANAALLASLIIHVFNNYKRNWWHWLVPIILAAAAFAIDLLVQTDLEKINILIKKSIKAIEKEDADKIDEIISPDYRDSYHNTKAHLMNYCRNFLSEPLVEKSKKISLTTEISSPNAALTLTVIIHFDKQSRIYRDYKSFIIIKMQLDLQKDWANRWLNVEDCPDSRF